MRIEPALGYAESLTAIHLNKPDEFSAYRLAWADLEARALDEQASKALITATQEGYARD
jgi:hypothetical protein